MKVPLKSCLDVSSSEGEDNASYNVHNMLRPSRWDQILLDKVATVSKQMRIFGAANEFTGHDLFFPTEFTFFPYNELFFHICF